MTLRLMTLRLITLTLITLKLLRHGTGAATRKVLWQLKQFRQQKALARLPQLRRLLPIAGLAGGLIALPLAQLSDAVGIGGPAYAQGSAKKGKSAANSENAMLRKRVQQLEEQLLDMQVMIGTLQSMAGKGGGGAVVMRSSGGEADSARMRQLETQIQALAAQVQNLSEKMRGRRGDAGGSAYGSDYAANPTYRPAPSYDSNGSSSSALQNQLRPSSAPFDLGAGEQITTGFGSTTVTPSGGGDSIGAYLSRNQAVAPSRQKKRLASRGNDPKQLYETAYGYLLQQNFGGAQSAFADFLELYPTDPLAGNAQYWLGETYFVRGKYRSAAKAFLKGYETYRNSNKAPDSLFKLAKSFDRLGQKQAACSSYGELRSKFPGAASKLRQRAAAESRRLGCAG